MKTGLALLNRFRDRNPADPVGGLSAAEQPPTIRLRSSQRQFIANVSFQAGIAK
jgi:hypothetical protein